MAGDEKIAVGVKPPLEDRVSPCTPRAAAAQNGFSLNVTVRRRIRSLSGVSVAESVSRSSGVPG